MSQQNLFDTEDKKRACEDLVKIADRMESCEPNSPESRELSKAYAEASKRAGITDKKGHVIDGNAFKNDIVKKSKLDALEKIKSILDSSELLDNVLKHTSGKEMFIISMLVNYKGMRMEVNLEHCDSFYKSYSGYACIKARKSLFSQKQLKGYPSVEYGLICFGMDLISNRDEKRDFFNKYAVPYNERIKNR